MAVYSGFPAGQELMTDPLAEDRAGVLYLGSPGGSRSTETCREWKDSPSGSPWAEAGEEMVRHTRGHSRKRLLLIESQQDTAVLNCHFQFRTHN